jgi:nucleoside-diphosphate-sugar epimerase
MKKNTEISSILIVGHGFLGRRIARMARETGYEVAATSRHESRRLEIESTGCGIVRFDINDIQASLPAFDAWIWCPAFDRKAGVSIRDAVVTGLARALEYAEVPPKRVVFTSTTSVYGQTSGEWVDETSICEPRSESGKAHLEAEKLLLDWAHDPQKIATILRLSGLYGPERVIRRQAIEAGEPIACRPDSWLNLVHGDDAAIACVHALGAETSGIYCISDDRPVTRRSYYETLARLLGAPAPKFIAPAASEDMGDKRVSARLARTVLGWQPKFADIEKGLEAALAR